jgi:hypothetical protein
MDTFGIIFAGFIVGFIVGLTGVGGGSLMTPILIFFFGIKPYLAVGTDLLFAAFTKAGGTLSLARQKLVPWPIVLRLSMGSIPAAGLTLWLLREAGPSTDAVQHIMKIALGLALLLTAAATMYKVIRGRATPVDVPEASEALALKGRHPLLPLLFGALIGTLVTLTSVGAGAIGVTVLMIMFPLLPLSRIIAADIAYAVPLTFVAGLGHASLGSVDWQMLAALLTGSLPGIWLGSRWVKRAPERVIRAVLSVLLAWAGTKLVTI